MAASYRFVVSGRVQGVGFRYSVINAAQRFSITGWVRNRGDGAVEGLASGTADDLERFREWLGVGPPAARVENVEWSASAEAAPLEFEGRREPGSAVPPAP